MEALLIILVILLVIGLLAANKPRKPPVLTCEVVRVELGRRNTGEL
jgi:hypothetical protein